MKISTFLLFLCIFQLFAASGNSQNATIQLSSTQLSLGQFFDQIEKQTDYLVVFSNGEVDVDETIHVKKTSDKVSEYLKEAFKDKSMNVEFENNYIILSRNSLKTVVQQSAFQISGTVIDVQGEPIIGANVIEKGTTNGVITDIDGRFTLQLKENAIIQISYIGYISQEIAVKNQRTITVTLLEDFQALEEVVVIGYGVQKKSSVTGAISQVRTEDLENRTISNAQQALQGKTAGVQIISASSGPGSTPTVRVRGYSSNETSDPLFVVDGVRLKDISGLDPNDIESMEVLKDAASAAIYGAEAGNGVILITTKKGKSGVGKISYNFQYTLQSHGKIPDLMNAQEYINYMTEANLFTQDYINQNWDGVTDTDWTKVAFENGKMQKHNVSFTNGNEKGNFYASLTYLDDNGIVVGDADYYKRLTAVVNTEYEIKKWLKVGTTNNLDKYNRRGVISNDGERGFMAAVLRMDPLTPVVYANNQLPQFLLDAQNSGKTLSTDDNGNYYGVSRFFNAEAFNPLVVRDQALTRYSGYSVNGSLYANVLPFDGFVFTSRLGYRFTGSRYSSTELPYYGNAVQSRDYVQQEATSRTHIYYQWENFANYMKTIDVHTINAMVGMSYQEYTDDYVTGMLDANGEHALLKNDPSFYYLNYGAASAVKGVEGEKTRNAQLSYFGRIGYDYEGKYIAQASLRADAADLSYLSLKKRWGYYPAVSAGWVLSEESFFEPVRSVVDNLKLRASWGQNGSLSSLKNHSYGTEMSSAGFYPFISGNNYVTGARPSSMGNEDMKWETSEQIDIGLDARFFNSRMNVTIDYFDKKTKDLLIWNTTPSLAVGGVTSPLNAGNVSNKGFEFEVGWRDQVKDFTYSIRANLATLKNKVTYLDPSLERISGVSYHINPITYFEEGYPIYYFRGYKSDGIDSATGDPKFVDIDGNGTIGDGDMTYIGDAIPDFTYGITLSAAWKGLDFTLFGTGSQGNEIFNCLNPANFPTGNRMTEIWYTDRWTPSNTSGSQPRAYANNIDKYILSDAMVFDGSYFKIKQIQVGYTLPKNVLNKIYIGNLRLYVSLEDFFTFTSYPGLDPEVSVTGSDTKGGMGVDKGGYPSSKKVVFGLNVEF